MKLEYCTFLNFQKFNMKNCEKMDEKKAREKNFFFKLGY